MPQCKQCGAQNIDGIANCEYCGSPLAPPKPVFVEQNQMTQTVATFPEQKSRLVAALLQFFLPFGIGRFYLGYVGIGVCQLLTASIYIGLLWSWADGVYIISGNLKTDAQGRPLKD
ncbi:TM2 domain-containing protein [Candidatus Sumerlaeota bacterium]|nr:TM2 domain-containing protein [Candidatus Sumerlaeota bacterium]